ncbi:hypothetical protein DSM106972_025400 [Dulcicalothrix desertica PCC 7102]|uniref:Uncharacterized protein n=1 Tax=Dulcicalothrix desertica PCC 7102 TaxID=232991 RepID=A0A3S1ARH1_9CYAN|nr:hypothetical protein [Dulcicalothrix desertica]RUT07279.1 hypothetical protein DSM106972_025400 [Dulcicalothrix desertica PCC 7102]TWH55517.1 hypothetical protein CAL7102_03661 [Dulcicalothrix desertica PCC 7102]
MEEIILSGTEETLKPVITLLIGIFQMIENRDIGDIVAMPVPEYVRANPLTTKLCITYFSKKEPPFFSKKQDKIIKAIYNIPDVKHGALKWEAIKNAAGGANGYQWGRFKARANLNNGREMSIYGASGEIAEKRLLELLTLSNAKIKTLSITEEKKEGVRASDQGLYKEATQMYPAYFSILNSEKIIIESNREHIMNARTTMSGTYKRTQTRRVALWVDKKPADCDAVIAEALRRGDEEGNQ